MNMLDCEVQVGGWCCREIVVRRLIIELLYCFLFFFCFSKTKSMANKLTNIRGEKGEFLFWKSREETRQ